MIIGIGLPESGLVKNVFRQLDHIDVIAAAVSHCGIKTGALHGAMSQSAARSRAKRIGWQP
jgi:hypothetical protein